MSHVLQLLLLLAVVVSAAKLAGALANRVGQPAVFGEILVGLVLGPTVLNILGWPVFATPAEASAGSTALLPVLRDLSEIGVVLLMFVAGLETDIVGLRRVGKVAFWSAFGGVVLPFVGGAAVAVAFGLPLYWQGIFVGAILTATSVSISAQTLIELGALRSREGSTILGAAVIDDVMGIIVLSVVVAGARASAGGVDLSQIVIVAVRMAAFFVVAVMAGRWLPHVFRWASALGVGQGGAGGCRCSGLSLCLGGGVPRRCRGDHRCVHCRGTGRTDGVQDAGRRRHSSAHVFDVRSGVFHRNRPAGQRPGARRSRGIYRSYWSWWP